VVHVDLAGDAAQAVAQAEAGCEPEEQAKFHFATAWFQESLDGWRALSTQMRATLRIARRVHDGLAADDGDWDTLPFLRDVLVGLVTPGFGGSSGQH
jgi:hypothetical protein